MVRTLPRLPALDLDAKRIAANSFVIALHAAALILLLAPVAWTPPAAEPKTITDVVFKDPPKIKPLLPVPLIPQPTASNTLPRQPIARPIAITPTLNTVEFTDPTGTEPAEIGDTTTTPIDTGTGEPALAQLALLHGPAPQYPRQSMREGQQGLVLLRVLVDVNGWPQEVVIERSSGHRLLDQAALREVKANWRFQPAVVDGAAVWAFALVPINFSLPR